jgi:hypothetical protein
MSKWQCIKRASFDGDIVITDPCYLLHGGGKEVLKWQDMKSFVTGHGGMFNTTYYGDWSCTVFKTGNSLAGGRLMNVDAIGEFCADSGTVCVIDLKHVREVSPKFEDWLKDHAWCGTVVRGFKGSVGLFKCSEGIALRVRGDGEVGGEAISFESKQTSL